MLKRRQSSERPPEPVYMDNQQMSDYLSNLRSNRPARPTGARPPPSSFRSVRQSLAVSSMVDVPENATETEARPIPVPASVSARRVSGHKKASSMSQIGSTSSRLGSNTGRPLVRAPSEEPVDLSYQESGTRWMEKQEARSLRLALQEMDMAEEQQLYDAASKEASDLVWKHQNPQAPENNPNAPYRYRDHLDKGSFTKRAAWDNDGIVVRKGRVEGNPSAGSRSASDGSDSALTTSSASSRVPSDGSARSNASRSSRMRRKSLQFASSVLKKGEEKVKGIRVPSVRKAFSTMELKSGNDNVMVEEPQATATTITTTTVTSTINSNTGSVDARNPFSRVRNARSSIFRSATPDPVSGRPPYRERVEIQRNPPSQSRNAEYTSTPPLSINDENKPHAPDTLKMKDGKEIRDDDIRKATSMSLRDRSPKLPTPTMVSDRPGRPIVSFQNDWTPKQIDLKQERSTVTSSSRPANFPMPSTPAITISGTAPAPPTRSNTFPIAQASAMPIPSIIVPDQESPVDRPRSIPTICFPDDDRGVQSKGSTPSIAADQAPSISISPPVFSVSAPPSISVSAPPAINVSGPSVAISPPSISISHDDNSSGRPLPIPSRTKKQRPQWAIPTQANLRSSVLCNECAMPIAGRIVTAAGVRFHPACFRCHHCSEALECVAFFPEPDNKRAERLAAEANSSEVVDDSLRFYCHLDYHEFFSPRCKSCKTPIEGDVVVACGAEWHAGHFFCAQCGDPFEQSTPFVEKDGYAWCVNCHTNRYSTKCKKCRKPVVDTVLKALGGEWHEDCFCCHECGGKFDDGRYFLREGEEDPVCPRCEERRLKA